MQPSLFDLPVEDRGDPPPPDQAAREFAVDPRNDVVLEASAGTGKTSVLANRYVRLVEEGVDPRNILAVTFTRKAAAEMRDRILASLRRDTGDLAARDQAGRAAAARRRAITERVADVQISTIDAFCFSLLREFPLEAQVDPAFEIVDETEMARFAREALDLTLRASRGLVASDENVRLLFARVKLGPLREAIQGLLDRRHLAAPAVAAFVERRVRWATATEAAAAFLDRLAGLFAPSAATRALLEDGPDGAAEFRRLRDDVLHLGEIPPSRAGRVQQLQRRLQRYFLTDQGTPRQRLASRFRSNLFASPEARRRHEAAMRELAPGVSDALDRLDADVQGLLARGLQRVLAIAMRMYEGLLDEHAVLDFAGMLAKAVELLGRQEEFARSRLKLQSRYHHVLVDEFQDTNRLQWRLVERLVDAWGEGEGVQDAPTSIFVVGDRKQSIYRFRLAEVTLLDEVADKIAALRPGRPVRQAISHSFRAVPELLVFVNALSAEMQSGDDLCERFNYDATDRFPVGSVAAGARRDAAPVLGLVAEASMDRCAQAVATEVVELLAGTAVRTPAGVRPARPDDIAILFRARTGHQYFESALEARGVRTYVYKGLGFFDAPEVQDLQALLRYLAQPDSDLRAAELLRSRFVRLSDAGLVRLAPGLAEALRSEVPAARDLEPIDRDLLQRAHTALDRWLPLVDRMSPSELVDTIIGEAAYVYELRGRRRAQARENLKKMRSLMRRIENRGYATVGRIAEYFETLRAGDESHAVVEAAGCVNLMTIHAAKGLEFPIVFLVNLHVPGRGRSAAFSVIERGPDGEPEVAFGSTDATRLEDRREREELRRLLYVATTRARDRLYFAAQIDEAHHTIRKGARSLASLLPQTLADQFAAAASSDAGEVEWPALEGTFAFRVCRPEGETHAASAQTLGAVPVRGEPDVSPVAAAQPLVVTASASLADQPANLVDAGDLARGSDRVIGTAVHRLFQRQVPADALAAAVAALVPQVMSPEELVDVQDVKALTESAADLYLRMRRRPGVVTLLGDGVCYYEVPFSWAPPDRPGTIVRGRIDCVVMAADGRMTIVEFKTGRPQPEHATQVQLYRQALEQAAPGRQVRTELFYR